MRIWSARENSRLTLAGWQHRARRYGVSESAFRNRRAGVNVPLPPSRAIVLAQTSGTNGGAVAGAATGAVGGAIVGGPVSAVVGGAAGPVAGSVVDSVSNEDRIYVRRYSEERRYPSVKYDRDLAVGGELPADMTYYDFEGRPSIARYRYARINDRTVLVDPQTHRIVEIIE